MDMSATTITTNTAVTGGSCGGLNIVPLTKSPEAESETPPRVQPSKPISFSNGVLKRHAPPQTAVYKECLKNHAASLGGHALDGCGEFMPAHNATASDPTSLKCAACGCHRNFHRREPEELTAANITNPPPTTLTHVIEYHPHHRHHPLPPPPQPPSSTPHTGPNPARSPGSQSPPPISSSFFPGSISAPHMLLALSSGGAAVSGGGPDTPTPTTNGPHPHHHQFPTHVMNSSGSSRKRFRTKFSQEQKEKMHEFAEKVGWKMQKTNEEMIINFCNEINVERGVFKVWMHNNKNTFGRRSNNNNPSIVSPLIGSNSGGGGNGTNQALNVNLHGINQVDDDDHDNDEDDDDDDEDGGGVEIGNLNGNSHHHNNQHIIHHHNHQNHQQYNNGGKISESNVNVAPTNGSSSSS